jgi:hypothetical protein
MRLRHALLSVFVGKDRGSCGVKRRVVIGVVEVPVGVDDVFQRSVAEAIKELRQIRSFLSVAETLHFGRTAELIHLSQPATSS